MGRKKTTPIDLRKLPKGKDVKTPNYYAAFATATPEERRNIRDENYAELREDDRIRHMSLEQFQEEEKRIQKEVERKREAFRLKTESTPVPVGRRIWVEPPVAEELTPSWIKGLVDLLPETPRAFDELVSMKSQNGDSFRSSFKSDSATPYPPSLTPDRTNSSRRSSDTQSSNAAETQNSRDTGSQDFGSHDVCSQAHEQTTFSAVTAACDSAQVVTPDLSLANNVQSRSSSGQSDGGAKLNAVDEGCKENLESKLSDSTTIVADSSSTTKSDTSVSASPRRIRPMRARRVLRKPIDDATTTMSPTKKKASANPNGSSKEKIYEFWGYDEDAGMDG